MSLAYDYSCNVDVPVRVHIKRFEGERVVPSISELIEDSEIRLSGVFLKPSSDLVLSCQLFCNDEPLAHPVHTAYKSFHDGTAWDEWLELPVHFGSLLRDACLAFTIWDVKAPRKKVPVGGAVLRLFRDDGRVKEGDFSLELIPGVKGDVAMDGVGAKVSELDRLEKLALMKATGELDSVAWLDPLAGREIQNVKEACKAGSASMYVMVSLPRFDVPVVYSEMAGDLVKQPGGSIMDPEILYTDNLVENKHHKLTRGRRRDFRTQDLKPNPATRDMLAALTAKPPAEVISIDDKDLIWRFRFYLSKDKKALTKFLRCIEWDDKTEAKQAIELMEKWDPIDVDDALELMGKNFKDNQAVRSYGVSRLDTANAEDLSLYLLQLVQALKYEPLTTEDGSFTQIPQSKHEGGSAAVGDVPEQTQAVTRLAPLSLAGFLIRRALEDRRLGSYLYWYLLVECKDTSVASSQLYIRVYQHLVAALENGTPEQRDLRLMLKRQKDFLTGLRNVSTELQGKGAGNRLKKIETLKTILRDTPQFRSFDPLALPLDADIIVTGIKADAAYVFKSALNPLKITFFTQSRMEYSIIYKNGDDLRQDQLCIQMLLLIDKLLKSENLDLKLTPYQAMATSPEIGMVEMVIPSDPVASVLKEYGGIQKYLQKYNRDESAPYQISKDAMDTYVKSCAGYCVYTYLLGIGDRHFDNLMLCPDGHLFHIDFGYILGRDPKPYPPPMKLTKEMVEAMGGEKSEELRKFRSHCYSAFLILRKHANLILNLFSLMVDSSVHDIALDPDKTVMKVQEKFKLELNDEEAVKHMEDLISQSVNAMFAVFVERIHSWAQYWRK